LLLYGLTRWYHLTMLPIHFDEIVYLDRVNRIVSRQDFFIGLRDDLRTGHLWVMALLWPLSPDRLWVGRFASSLAGLWGGVGVYKCGALLFSNRRIGLLASVFYLIVPGIFFYDRMALADSLLTTCGIWILYGSAAYFRGTAQRLAWWMAPVVALAMITKPNGFLFLSIPALGYVLLRDYLKRGSPIGPLRGETGFRPAAPRKNRLCTGSASFRIPWGLVSKLLSVLPLLVGGGIGVALISPFLGNTQGMLWGKAGAGNISGWSDLARRFGQNLILSADWLVSLVSLPMILLAVGGLVLALYSRETRRQAVWLALVGLVQWLFMALVSEVWYPRYLLPVAPSMVLLAAYAAYRLTRLSLKAPWRVASAVALVALMWPAYTADFWLLVDPSRAPLHPEESRQYIRGWPSGYGLAEVVAFLGSLADEYQEVYVAYNEDSIMVRRGLAYYMSDPPANIEFESFDPFEGGTVEKLNAMAADRPTFVVLNSAHEKGLDDFILNPDAFPQARRAFRVTRPGGLTSWDVYQWIPR
jgi:4-amino-4-deoxy-L-arabinose transferase-like glycosyltransferase